MKRVGNLYEKLCDPEAIKTAILKASKGKRNRGVVKGVLARMDTCVDAIRNMLLSETYEPEPYLIKDIYDTHSKKYRTIRKPKFYPDQIIHWALIIAIQPVIMRGMYYWSCGSIRGRGSAHGQKAIRRWLTQDRKNTKYCLKLDIRHFYDSIDQEILIELLGRKIKDRRVLALAEKIIKSTEHGIPIGNYTSQWLANFYLEGVDHYVKETLGIKYYVRYIDDLVLFGRNKKELHTARRKLFAYINNTRKLEVKGDWQLFPIKSRGVDFLGYVFYRDHTALRARNFLPFRRQCKRARGKIQRGQNIPHKMAAGLISRAGQLKHCDSQNIKRKYYDGLDKHLKESIQNESQRKRRPTGG